jgi:hypothetical protein
MRGIYNPSLVLDPWMDLNGRQEMLDVTFGVVCESTIRLRDRQRG